MEKQKFTVTSYTGRSLLYLKHVFFSGDRGVISRHELIKFTFHYFSSIVLCLFATMSIKILLFPLKCCTNVKLCSKSKRVISCIIHSYRVFTKKNGKIFISELNVFMCVLSGKLLICVLM